MWLLWTWEDQRAIQEGSRLCRSATLQAAAAAPELLAGASDVSLGSLGTRETFVPRGSGRRGGTRANLTLGDDMVQINFITLAAFAVVVE